VRFARHPWTKPIKLPSRRRRAGDRPNERPGSGLYIASSGSPAQKLIPYKGLKFRVQEFADVVVEFVEENGQITAVKQIDPSGKHVSKRK
jgi:hypothetical protein